MQEYDDLQWTPPAALAELAQAPTPWGYYLNTMVRFDALGAGGTLRPVDNDGGVRPPLGPLHVVTAIQPDPEPEDRCRARMQILDRHLHSAGIRSISAVGSSLAGDHSEESRAVFGLTDGQARALGARFGQVAAVFGWSGPRWSLLACVGDRQSHRPWQWEPAMPPV